VEQEVIKQDQFALELAHPILKLVLVALEVPPIRVV